MEYRFALELALNTSHIHANLVLKSKNRYNDNYAMLLVGKSCAPRNKPPHSVNRL